MKLKVLKRFFFFMLMFLIGFFSFATKNPFSGKLFISKFYTSTKPNDPLNEKEAYPLMKNQPMEFLENKRQKTEIDNLNYALPVSNWILASTGTATLPCNPTGLTISSSIVIIQGSNTVLTAISSSTTYICWSPPKGLSCINCANPVASPTETTQYCVEVNDGSCFYKACVMVEVICPDSKSLGMPNAFTPNGDGNNDVFCLQGWNAFVSDFSILIYDRWGEKVFESYNPDFCWDGIYRGQTLNPAVFVYYVKASFNNCKEFTKKGNISLIR